jgi:Leucine-rich repeat (LRR) protein
VPVLELPQLERLDVGGNGLAELPDVPASVRELYIYDNALERLPALPSGLRVLDANRNRLVELPPLVDVAFVYAASNRLVAAPPMRGCRYASFSGNRLEVLPGDRALEELRLEDGGLAALALGELTALRELHLRGNALVEVPASLARCARLRVLDLRGNRLDDLPEALAELPLVKLDLRWNPLRHGPRWLGRLASALVYT